MKGILFFGVVIFSTCNTHDKKTKIVTISNDSLSKTTATMPDKKAFEKIIDGKQANLFVLKSKNNIQTAITNYGGRIVSLLVPAKNNGKMIDVVVGFKTLDDYINSTEPYFGATIGRYGNRIAKGKFTLDNKEYTLTTNNGLNTLHGGKKGFQYVVWDAAQPNDSTLELSYLSKDMEEGYPGNVTIKVTYALTGKNELKCVYEATTDKKTVINLTNHAFFNLNGEGSGTILNHSLQIFANTYTPIDSTLIPTGKTEPVAGTVFDFTKKITIGARIETANEQLKNGKGYDHNFVLNETITMKHAATVIGDKTNIIMDVYTDEPGLQFYSGNFMQSKNTFKNGTKDDFRTAFCLETQHFPDAPNQPQFPSTVLNKGEKYFTQSVYKFSIGK
jgi:aldose 1-epimerase